MLIPEPIAVSPERPKSIPTADALKILTKDESVANTLVGDERSQREKQSTDSLLIQPSPHQSLIEFPVILVNPKA